MLCRKCNKPIIDGAKFCRFCGAKVNFYKINFNNLLRTTGYYYRKIKTRINFGGLVVIVIVLFFLFVLIYSDSDDGYNSSSGEPTQKSKQFELQTQKVKDLNRYNEIVDNSDKAIKNIASHIESISEYKGISYDELGRSVKNYLFKNEDVNLNLLVNNLNYVNQEINKFRQSISEQVIYNSQEVDTIFTYYKTANFFVLAEQWERAFFKEDLKSLRQLKEHIELFDEDTLFTNWLKSKLLYDRYLRLLNTIDESYNLAVLGVEITNNESTLEEYKNSLDYYERLNYYDDYNDLVPIYNNLLNKTGDQITDYNLKLATLDSEQLYASFIGLVDVYILFPAQDTLELEEIN